MNTVVSCLQLDSPSNKQIFVGCVIGEALKFLVLGSNRYLWLLLLQRLALRALI